MFLFVGVEAMILYHLILTLFGNIFSSVVGFLSQSRYAIIGTARGLVHVISLDIFITVLISIFIWLSYGLIVYLMFHFHSFDLPIIAAYSVVVLTFLATSLPAAPGFLGTFQYGCFLALTGYGVSVDAAAFFSLSYYLVMIGMNVLLGLIFFPVVNLDSKFLDRKK